ncbi:hypothetical protein ACI7MW_14690 [Pseudomonas lundensis]
MAKPPFWLAFGIFLWHLRTHPANIELAGDFLHPYIGSRTVREDDL